MFCHSSDLLTGAGIKSRPRDWKRRGHTAKTHTDTHRDTHRHTQTATRRLRPAGAQPQRRRPRRSAAAAGTFSQTHGRILTVISHINDVPCLSDPDQATRQWSRRCPRPVRATGGRALAQRRRRRRARGAPRSRSRRVCRHLAGRRREQRQQQEQAGCGAAVGGRRRSAARRRCSAPTVGGEENRTTARSGARE